jgi:hypothetical protein
MAHVSGRFFLVMVKAKALIIRLVILAPVNQGDAMV